MGVMENHFPQIRRHSVGSNVVNVGPWSLIPEENDALHNENRITIKSAINSGTEKRDLVF